MKLTRLLIPVAAGALAATAATPVAAAPDGPQRLRGMEGRVFAVTVEVAIDEGPTFAFDNCYRFEAGGVWIDDRAPIPGTWEQARDGASTPYEATIALPDGTTVVSQTGTVSPATGGGTLRLTATSRALFPGFGPGTAASTGQEVETCTID